MERDRRANYKEGNFVVEKASSSSHKTQNRMGNQFSTSSVERLLKQRITLTKYLVVFLYFDMSRALYLSESMKKQCELWTYQ